MVEKRRNCGNHFRSCTVPPEKLAARLAGITKSIRQSVEMNELRREGDTNESNRQSSCTKT